MSNHWLPYDPSLDPPNDVVDRVFPLDQCLEVPRTYLWTASGPHNVGYVRHSGDEGFGRVWVL